MTHAEEFSREAAEIGLLPIATLVSWCGCLAVGVVGFLIPYPRPPARDKSPTPVQAQVMHVELAEDSWQQDIGPPSQPQSAEPQPPVMPDVIAAPAALSLAAVAAPNPAIAFALPVDGPMQTVEAKQAIPSRSVPTTAALQSPRLTTTAAPPQRLTYGQGEGRQPAPQYPREAAMARQEGTVVVRFTVGEDGRVQAAQAITPSRFPLLNQAAVRAVRETWRFRAGPVRSYEVAIQFQLKQHSE